MALKQKIDKGSALGRLVAQRTGDWLTAQIDEHLESSSSQRHDPGWFHPSALGNPCDALLAFQYLGITGKGTTSARSQKILDNGTSRHEDISRYLVQSGVSVFKHWGGSDPERFRAASERSFTLPALHLRGTIDDLIQNTFTGEKYIFEFKTMNRDEWEKLRVPKPEHVLQVHPYMFGFGVLQTQLTYENKNTQEWKNFIVKFDGVMWQSVEMRLQNIVNRLEQRQLPERTPMQRDSNCQFYWACAGFIFKEE